MRSPRFREWVNAAELDAVLGAHRRHQAACFTADVAMRQEYFFLEPLTASYLWFCSEECRWCAQVRKRCQRAENLQRRQRVLACNP